MQIRESINSEISTLFDLHRRAFGEPEGDTVAQLAIDLLEDPTAAPLLSLVAAEAGEILGHCIFSTISVADKATPGAYILSPLAVDPGAQSAGIGSSLINNGLELLRNNGGELVMVLGDPNYYRRFGFHTEHQLSAPHALEYPEAWMAQALQPGALDRISGAVRCADVLNAPEHW